MSGEQKLIRNVHEIEAVCWKGDNFDECDRFTNGYVVRLRPKDDRGGEVMLTCGLFTRKVAKVGDFIVRDGEFITVWTPEEMAEKTTVVFIDKTPKSKRLL